MFDIEYNITSYDYDLPAESIAQLPTKDRDASKLLVMQRRSGKLADRCFADILDYLEPGDLLVANDTEVFPARLIGRKQTGGRVELFILEYPTEQHPQEPEGNGNRPISSRKSVKVIGLIKSSKRVRPGMKLLFASELEGEVHAVEGDGKVEVRLYYQGDLATILEKYGQVPLPPYIHRVEGTGNDDRDRYQTVYARQPGAVAAPTAGLHFTEPLLQKISQKGIGIEYLTLHVGYGTFAPVRENDIRQHKIHREFVTVTEESAERINATRAKGGRIWAVGTTTLRSLEFAADQSGKVRRVADWCDLYIYPGYSFKLVRNLITNFHLPKSSLLFLVSAFCGREQLLKAYRHAVEHGYRFYSYGDAMAIIDE